MSTIGLPRIWRPGDPLPGKSRNGSWWRLPRITEFLANLGAFGGNLIHTASGPPYHLATGCTPPTPPACGLCPSDEAPGAFITTIVGWTPCPNFNAYQFYPYGGVVCPASGQQPFANGMWFVDFSIPLNFAIDPTCTPGAQDEMDRVSYAAGTLNGTYRLDNVSLVPDPHGVVSNYLIYGLGDTDIIYATPECTWYAYVTAVQFNLQQWIGATGDSVANETCTSVDHIDACLLVLVPDAGYPTTPYWYLYAFGTPICAASGSVLYGSGGSPGGLIKLGKWTIPTDGYSDCQTFSPGTESLSECTDQCDGTNTAGCCDDNSGNFNACGQLGYGGACTVSPSDI
jgi:hypothetical protein